MKREIVSGCYLYRIYRLAKTRAMIVLVVVRKILGGRSMSRLIKVVLVYHHQNIGMNIDKR